jgi:hypothetical protein
VYRQVLLVPPKNFNSTTRGALYRQQWCAGRVQQLHLFSDLFLPLAFITIGDNKVEQLDRREVKTTTRVTFGGGR